MSNTFKLNNKGVIELYKSAGMRSVLASAGDAVARAAGEGYGSSVDIANFTAIGVVYTQSFAAQLDNAKNNTLLKACSSAGLRMRG